MPSYKYKAVTDKQQIVANRVDAQSRYALLKKLQNNGLTPITIEQDNSRIKSMRKQKKNRETNNSVLKTIEKEEIEKSLKRRTVKSNQIKEFIEKNSKIKRRDIIVFTQNFYLLKKANFNNIHALATVIETIENPTFRDVISDILLGVEAGENMYTTMEYYEGIFPPIYINMIRIGEQSGALTNSLEQAIKYLEETEAMNKKLKGILIPNILQFVILCVLLVVGTVVSVPMIQGVFEQVGSKDKLPAITIWFSNFLNGITKIWYIPVGIIAIIVFSIIFYIKTPKGKYNWHNFKYRMPLFGKLVYAIDFSRLIKSINLNLKNGMRIQDALETSKNVSNNLVMLSLVETAINNIIIGQSWIEPFENSGLSSPMITEMLKIGMQTDLSEMMEKLTLYMDIDINNILEKVMKALPQIVYAIVGIMLIFVTVVVLVPLIQVYMGGWMFSAFT